MGKIKILFNNKIKITILVLRIAKEIINLMQQTRDRIKCKMEIIKINLTLNITSNKSNNNSIKKINFNNLRHNNL